MRLTFHSFSPQAIRSSTVEDQQRCRSIGSRQSSLAGGDAPRRGLTASNSAQVVVTGLFFNSFTFLFQLQSPGCALSLPFLYRL